MYKRQGKAVGFRDTSHLDNWLDVPVFLLHYLSLIKMFIVYLTQ